VMTRLGVGKAVFHLLFDIINQSVFYN
jgi:hypothetical protein